jgi:hypothetical protein
VAGCVKWKAATKWAGASFADKFEEVDLKDGEC